ncbi:hypothetical protein LEP1GSC061_0600 [Leptospira wolffii serovar Khorat str. Khorat-H2]|nr:hypothetical protein LEP1GSC061_0600 [Leptospira wolffii serovar Khorat str. Khorat-H2]
MASWFLKIRLLLLWSISRKWSKNSAENGDPRCEYQTFQI